MATHLADLSEINPHLALAVSESFVSDGERDWLRFVRKVEKKLGHDLDGDQDCDGYSLDYALATFEAGVSADVYAAEVISNEAAQEAAFGPRLD